MNRLRFFRLVIFIILLECVSFLSNVSADSTLDSKTLEIISNAVFEVVVLKPTKDSLSYERPLPLNLLPYSIRTDKYYPIGTAFAISPTEFLSAAHVMNLGLESQFKEVSLRDKDGKVYSIDKIDKYSERKDFVTFSLRDKAVKDFLRVNTNPQINQKVFAVGNALGEGIVIRDGLFTSATPEQENGEWKWIRFSAAASPGNSGGPLLDKDGKVIGIILQKSPNENLNYALPIKEAIDAKANLATAYKKIGYFLDNAGLTKLGVFKKEIYLPKSYQELNRELIEGTNLSLYNLLKALFKENKDNIFPNGKGSTALLHKTYDAISPNLIMRGSDDNWDASSPKEEKEADLSNNGRLRYGNLANSLLLYIQKPDDIPLKKFYDDTKLFMDLILKGISLPRQIGSENIKITSLGNGCEDYVFIDSHGRKWLVRTWSLEYSDEKVVTLSLPVPGGCITMMKAGQTGQVDFVDIPDLKILTNFIYVSYYGTLKQWEEFIKIKELLPSAFSSINVSFDYNKAFYYKSKRLSFSYSSDGMAVSEKSYMKLKFDYFRESNKTIWDVGTIVVGEDKNNWTNFNITRNMKPPKGLGDKYESHWEIIEKQKFPFNHSAFYRDKATNISTVFNQSDAESTSVLYTIGYEKEGKVDQKEMEAKLNKFIRNLKIYEDGKSGDLAYNIRKDTYHDQGEYYQAVFDIDRLVNINPQYADGYILRGEVFKDKGDYNRAIMDYGKAAELTPEYVQTYFGKDFIALLYGIKGQFREAQEETGKVLQSDRKVDPIVKTVFLKY
ncbi:MAG: trypsin-like peptidase domain-containing protein [Thermodesulfobacteriota bacterium]